MEKEFYDIKMKDLTYGRGYVYSLQYHIVWCTKDLARLQAYHREVLDADYVRLQSGDPETI